LVDLGRKEDSESKPGAPRKNVMATCKLIPTLKSPNSLKQLCSEPCSVWVGNGVLLDKNDFGIKLEH
jgi:hypothetical protein